MTSLLVSFLLFAATDTKRPAPGPSFELLAKQASTAKGQNRLDEAIVLYRKALKLRPSWIEGWWFLGTLLYAQDRYPEARDAFRRFTVLDAKGAPGFALLGLCEYQTKEYQRALAHLNEARRLGLSAADQMNSVALYHTAALLTHFQQYEPAGQILLSLVRQGNVTPAMIEAMGLAALRKPLLPGQLPAEERELVFKTGRAVCSAGERQVAKAQKEFDGLLRSYPNAPNVHYIYGSFLLSNNPDGAIREFQKELEISPGHLPVLVSLAMEYLKRGEPNESLKYAEEAVTVDAKSFASQAALGRVLVDLGQLDKGIEHLEVSVKLAPDSPQTRIALASAYAKVGRKDDAARERTEFLRLKKLSDPETTQ
jgi:tetratricopeptide (TPR) repeat protein